MECHEMVSNMSWHYEKCHGWVRNPLELEERVEIKNRWVKKLKKLRFGDPKTLKSCLRQELSPFRPK